MPVIFTVGIVSTILVASIIVGTQAWFFNEWADEEEYKSTQAPQTELAILRDKQKDVVLKGGVDENTKNTGVPIDQAVKTLIANYPIPKPATQSK